MLDDWNWTVGEVAATFGLRGELKINLRTDFPDRFQRAMEVCLRPGGGPGAGAAPQPALMRVQSARLHKGQVLLKLEGLDSIEVAERWRGAQVQVRRADAVPLPAGSYYSADLVGMEVVARDGRVLGSLDEVLHYPAQDLFRVGKALIPAVREIVTEIDVASRRITVDPPSGLLPEE